MKASSIAGLHVEECKSHHLPQVLDIYNHYVLNTAISFDIGGQPLSYIEETYKCVLKESLPYLVALEPPTSDNERTVVIGYAYATQLRPRDAYSSTVEATIYVHPSFTGKGCGVPLFSALIQKLRQAPQTPARQHGVREVLAVSSLNPDQDNRGFYKKFGFLQVGQLKGVGYKFGKWWDTVYMQLSLQPSDNGTKEERVEP